MSQSHVRDLAAYAASLRGPNFDVPDFDPLDGGVHARALFLMEKPGPKAAFSGFVSRDNDDPTAEAILRFMDQAGLTREQTVLWNVVPGWNGTREITREELRQGVAAVEDLLRLLPQLSAIVMVGNRAARARRFLEKTGKSVFSSTHPSPIVRASKRARWDAIPQEWATVAAFLEGEDVKAEDAKAEAE